MSENLVVDAAYRDWVDGLKKRFQHARLAATIRVNSELLNFYWDLGANIVEKQKSSQWGDKLLAQLSRDLMYAFPSMKGFSKRNLELIRQWYLFWEGDCEFAKQAVSQMIRLPWGHNLKIVSKCQTREEACFYVNAALSNGWSRNVLVHQIESRLWDRQGLSQNNFARLLPDTQSDLANQLLKDPYVFDFIDETNIVDERSLEKSLIEHVTQFLLELGSGFAYIGKQVLVKVGERDFYLDLLFYHTKLHCYVVVELKMGEFEPEYAGKLNFYIKAVDEQLRGESDAPTIGILLCKSKDRLVVDYALSDIHKPMGVSEYVLGNALPDHLKRLLPSLDDFELELQDVKKAEDNRL